MGMGEREAAGGATIVKNRSGRRKHQNKPRVENVSKGAGKKWGHPEEKEVELGAHPDRTLRAQKKPAGIKKQRALWVSL